MLAPRVIPCLLYSDRGLVKTRCYRDPVYIGDPVNTARIFNDSGADELILLDIRATIEGRPPRLDMISQVASECFMPLTYGGGIRTPDQVRAILNSGVEKVAINTGAIEDPSLIERCAARFGRQAIVASIDVSRAHAGGPQVFARGGTRPTGLHPVELAGRAESLGAGEILLGSIDCDGTMQGYDVDVIRSVAESVDVPVIACGGAGGLHDFRRAVTEGGASAVAAGSLFVFYGRHRAVLIGYPERAGVTGLFE